MRKSIAQKGCIIAFMILAVLSWQVFINDTFARGETTQSGGIEAEAFAEGWTEWTSGDVSIDFVLNYIDAEAKVSLPGNPTVATGYMTNANQFGVVITMGGNNYTYTFADGSSESSGVFFAIENNGSQSPYVLKPSFPANNSWNNPNGVVTDYKYYYSNNKVKEESTIELAIGEKLLFTQIVEFKNSGIYHNSYFTNIGLSDIPTFRILNKVDTYLDYDGVPVYYGESQHTYYLKNGPLKLRVSGLDGVVDGSLATKHQRIWKSGFVDTYRMYNPAVFETIGNPGDLVFSSQWPDDDSEIIFTQVPFTLAVGETAEQTFVINFLPANSVTVNYLDELGNEIA